MMFLAGMSEADGKGAKAKEKVAAEEAKEEEGRRGEGAKGYRGTDYGKFFRAVGMCIAEADREGPQRSCRRSIGKPTVRVNH